MTDKIRKHEGFSLLEVMYVMALSITFYLFISVFYRDLFAQVEDQSISRDLEVISQGAALAKRDVTAPTLTDIKIYAGADLPDKNPLGYDYQIETETVGDTTIVSTQVRNEESALRIAFDIGSNAYVTQVSGDWVVHVEAVHYPDLSEFLEQINALTVTSPLPIGASIKFSPEQVRIVEGEPCGSDQAIAVVTRDLATQNDKYKDIDVTTIANYGRVVTCQGQDYKKDYEEDDKWTWTWTFPYQTLKCGDYTDIDLVDLNEDYDTTRAPTQICTCKNGQNWNPTANICCPAGTTYDFDLMICDDL